MMQKNNEQMAELQKQINSLKDNLRKIERNKEDTEEVKRERRSEELRAQIVNNENCKTS